MRCGEFSKTTFYKETIAAIKSLKDPMLISSASVQVSDQFGELVGVLRPLVHGDIADSRVIQILALWRSQHQYAYPTRFSVSIEGTKTWLERGVQENANRILFLLEVPHHGPVGHIGLLLNEMGELEIDNVLRGDSVAPGLMALAMRALEEFVYEELGANVLQLKVLQSNQRALNFYKKYEYKAVAEVPMGSVKIGETEHLRPNLKPTVDTFVTMEKDLVDSRKVAESILTSGPSIGIRERWYTADAVSYGWNHHHSDFLTKFESTFAEYVGAEYAIATSSCTGALHLALLALGVGPGDEVIVPETTWVATAAAVMYVGAKPVFADVDISTWTITAESVGEKISTATRVVMPVHLYGYPCDVSSIRRLCHDRGIAIVEDAAPAIGTMVGAETAGTIGDFGCYSFQGAKMLVTGEGGMLVTSDQNLYQRARKIQDHGRRPGTFWIEEVGRKYKMSNTSAALGLAQLQRSELLIDRKMQINGWYQEYFADDERFLFQQTLAGGRSIHWMSSIKILESLVLDRDELGHRLSSLGIDTRPVFPPISSYNIWGKMVEPCPNAQELGRSAINLPSGVKLSKKSVKKIVDCILRIADDAD
jgi:perosamine synthetase